MSRQPTKQDYMATLVKRAYATPEENQGRYEFSRRHGRFRNLASRHDEDIGTLAAAVLVGAFDEDHRHALSGQCTRLAASLLADSTKLNPVAPKEGDDILTRAHYGYYKAYQGLGCRTKGEYYLEFAKETALEHLDKLTDSDRTRRQHRKDPMGKKIIETFEELKKHYYGHDSNDSLYARLAGVFHGLKPHRGQITQGSYEAAPVPELQRR